MIAPDHESTGLIRASDQPSGKHQLMLYQMLYHRQLSSFEASKILFTRNNFNHLHPITCNRLVDINKSGAGEDFPSMHSPEVRPAWLSSVQSTRAQRKHEDEASNYSRYSPVSLHALKRRCRLNWRQCPSHIHKPSFLRTPHHRKPPKRCTPKVMISQSAREPPFCVKAKRWH